MEHAAHFREENMLVLSRRIGESIVISHDILIRVVDVSGSRVRLGIEAPKDVAICRSESRTLVAGAHDV